MAHSNTLTLFGSFGFGNLGDELIPHCFRALLAAAGETRPVKVLSRFRDTQIGETAPFPETGQGGPHSGALILAGGGIIEPRAMSCMNRAFALKSDRPGLTVATHAISVEPGLPFGWRQRRALQRQLAHIGPTTVRDVLSAEVLMHLAPGHRTRVIGDTALWMDPGEVPVDLAAMLPGRAIPVILGDIWETQDFFDWLTGELSDLARNLNAALLLLPFSGVFGKDMPVHRTLRDRLAEIAPDIEVVFPLETLPFASFSPGAVATILGNAPLVVSMRLHGCVLSYAMHTPFIGLAYHPKLRGFAETVGARAALVPHTLPERQSSGTYGFRFADLELKPGAMSAAADAVMKDFDFSAIPYFRRQQVMAVRDLIARLA
ncbi:MAG: polysaccharide pyruvyl transferase family protein, partial [Pseudomonadota bacterium]